MDNKPQVIKTTDPGTGTGNEGEIVRINTEKEIDADNKLHETSPDLIQKEDHHLPVDDEVKKG